MSEHPGKSHSEGSLAESDLKRLISRVGSPFGFSNRSGRQRGGGLQFGVSGASGCRAFAGQYEGTYACVLPHTQRRLQEERLRTSRKAGSMSGRNQRAAPGRILCNQRQAGMNITNYFPRSIISEPVHCPVSQPPDIPALPHFVQNTFVCLFF